MGYIFITWLLFHTPRACARFRVHIQFGLCLFFCFMFVCVRSRRAEDRATGEIPLNYTQMVINYRWHFGHRDDFIPKWGQPPLRSTMLVCVCNWLCVMVPSPVALFPAQRETHTHVHAYTHINMRWRVCVCWWVCVLVNPAAPSSTSECFDEHTHYAKECFMPGLPCAFRKG